LLSTLKIKTTSGPNGLSSHMLRNTAAVIAASLSNLFNLSLSSGVVPSEWKLSNVTPRLPGSGDQKCVTNCKPISLLSLVSKVLERIVHNHLLNFLLSNNLLSLRQFGFCPNSSSQEALLVVISDWSSHLNQGSSVAAVFFDLSKAFDKVLHHQLLPALAKVGVTGSLFGWFRNHNRFQRVVLDGHFSEVHLVSSGVPQGSILGPLLFSIYVNPLTSIPLSQGSSLILYADNIVLYRPILSPCDIDTLQEDTDKIADWIRSTGLCLNITKSKAVVFSRKKSHLIVNVTADNCAVPVVDSTRYLGVTVTSNLKWNTQINNTCAWARQQLGVIHRSFYEADPGTFISSVPVPFQTTAAQCGTLTLLS